MKAYEDYTAVPTQNYRMAIQMLEEAAANPRSVGERLVCLAVLERLRCGHAVRTVIQDGAALPRDEGCR